MILGQLMMGPRKRKMHPCLQAFLNLPSITDCQMKLVCKSSVLLSAMMISLEYFYSFWTWSLRSKFKRQRQGVRQESLKNDFHLLCFQKLNIFLRLGKFYFEGEPIEGQDMLREAAGIQMEIRCNAIANLN